MKHPDWEVLEAFVVFMAGVASMAIVVYAVGWVWRF